MVCWLWPHITVNIPGIPIICEGEFGGWRKNWAGFCMLAEADQEKEAWWGNKEAIGITRNLPEAYFRERNDHENVICFQYNPQQSGKSINLPGKVFFNDLTESRKAGGWRCKDTSSPKLCPNTIQEIMLKQESKYILNFMAEKTWNKQLHPHSMKSVFKNKTIVMDPENSLSASKFWLIHRRDETKITLNFYFTYNLAFPKKIFTISFAYNESLSVWIQAYLLYHIYPTSTCRTNYSTLSAKAFIRSTKIF